MESFLIFLSGVKFSQEVMIVATHLTSFVFHFRANMVDLYYLSTRLTVVTSLSYFAIEIVTRNPIACLHLDSMDDDNLSYYLPVLYFLDYIFIGGGRGGATRRLLGCSMFVQYSTVRSREHSTIFRVLHGGEWYLFACFARARARKDEEKK